MEPWLREIDIITIRHALSAGQDNPANYIAIGDFNIPLQRPTGIKQPEALGDALNDFFKANPPRGKIQLLSTPYLRGQETLGVYLPRIKSVAIDDVQKRDYLGEQRYGAINGIPEEKLATDFPEFLAERRKAEASGQRHLLRFPGIDKDGVKGESQDDVYQRMDAIFADARKAYDKGVRTLILNMHGTAGRAVQMRLLGEPSTDNVWQAWNRLNNCQADLISDGQRRAPIFVGYPDPTAARPLPHTQADRQNGRAQGAPK